MPCAGNVPIIVASGNLQYTGASLSQTTIFTPTVAGLYRVSLYLSPEPNGSYPAGSPPESLLLNWTDATAVRSLTVNGGYLDGGSLYTSLQPFTGVDLLIYSATDPIQVAASGGSISVTYDLYYAVEQLA